MPPRRASWCSCNSRSSATPPNRSSTPWSKRPTGRPGWGQFAALGLIYVVGFGVGLVALLYLGRLWQRPARPKTISLGPGAMSVAEAELAEPAVQAAALRTGMGIAAGIGLHNFSEGLAIGQAANGGQLALAGLLLVGFALHNMTEGFGSVGPLAAAKVRASWAGWAGRPHRRRPDLLGHHHRDLVQLHLPVRGLLAMAAGAPVVCHR
jgi:zinc transporter ZupT